MAGFEEKNVAAKVTFKFWYKLSVQSNKNGVLNTLCYIEITFFFNSFISDMTTRTEEQYLFICIYKLLISTINLTMGYSTVSQTYIIHPQFC